MSSVIVIQFSCAWIFLRRDFTQHKLCVTSNILSSIGYYTIPLLSFGIPSLVTAISYIWVIILLKQRKKCMSVLMHSRNSNVLSTNSKINKAILLTLGAYLLLYLPSVVISSVAIFIKIPHKFIIMSVCQLLYFMNNLVNPFIYYMTLKDFRRGYKNLLLCRNTREDHDRQLEMNAVRY